MQVTNNVHHRLEREQQARRVLQRLPAALVDVIDRPGRVAYDMALEFGEVEQLGDRGRVALEPEPGGAPPSHGRLTIARGCARNGLALLPSSRVSAQPRVDDREVEADLSAISSRCGRPG